MDLQDEIHELSKFGKVTLGQYATTGWHCGLKLFMVGKGVEIDVKSDFNHPTPREAVRQAAERLADALREAGDTSRRLESSLPTLSTKVIP
jgi:hypothetical protein